MFSKQEAQRLKTEFWTAFGKSFPRKWLLYDTKIKDFALKFSADGKAAEVSLEIGMRDEALRAAYLEKLESLEHLLADYVGDFRKDAAFPLEGGRTVARYWVALPGVSIFNKQTWRDAFEFFVQKMDGFERFFQDFEDYIREV